MTEKTDVDRNSGSPACSSPMSPEHFRYENYCCSLGYGGYDVFDHHADKPRNGFVELGRCDGMRLSCRPREGQAVMLWHEEDKVQFWIHLPLAGLV